MEEGVKKKLQYVLQETVGQHQETYGSAHISNKKPVVSRTNQFRKEKDKPKGQQKVYSTEEFTQKSSICSRLHSQKKK